MPIKLWLIKASGIDSSPLTPDNNNVTGNGTTSLSTKASMLTVKPIIQTPYIATENEITAKWRSILSHENKPIIGINWQGNPRAEKPLKGRSLPLLQFFKICGQRCLFLSLQKGREATTR